MKAKSIKIGLAGLFLLFILGCVGPRSPLNSTQTVFTNTVGVIQTNTVYVPNPAYVDAIQSARDVGKAAPAPFGLIIDAAGALLIGGLAWYARIKTNKAAGTQQLLETVIRGVEASNAPPAKASIQTIATALGVEDRLNAEVRKVTK